MPETEVFTVGQLLRGHRERLGLSQEELAGLVEPALSVNTIGNIERGHTRPYRRSLDSLAAALQLDAVHKTELTDAWRRFDAASADVTDSLRQLAPSGNLPTELTSFVGRGQELAEVLRVLASTRLLTLTGPGGVGKTRLALHVAKHAAERYADGVWLAEVAALRDPALVKHSVAATFGLLEEQPGTILDELKTFLGERQLLLLLDNCEHLLDACAELVLELLRASPQITVLTTTREPLSLPGEIAWLVPSLAKDEAGQLFAERASSARSGFAVDARNAATIARICQRLDGIPLAIELAAVRTRILALDQLEARLSNSLRLLAGSGRGTLPRHVTLRALVDWSHDLLSEEERVLFRRLAIFAGGWPLDAAEQVCASTPLTSPVLDVLAQLVDKSLVVVDAHAGEARYHLLETIRQYAQEKLQQSGELEALQHVHAEYFLRQAQSVPPADVGPRQAAWMDRLQGELDNLRAALDWCIEHDVNLGLKLCGALRLFWNRSGLLSEGRHYAAEFLERSIEPPPDAARLTEWRALRAPALLAAGHLAYRQVAAEAGDLLDASLELFRAIGEETGLTTALSFRGRVAMQAQDWPAAEAFLTTALNRARAEQNNWALQHTLMGLALTLTATGKSDDARPLHEEALAIARETNDTWFIPITLSRLALLALEKREVWAARRMLVEAAAIQRRTSFRTNGAWLLRAGVVLAAEEHRFRDAVRLAGAGAAFAGRYGSADAQTERMALDRLALAKRKLGQSAASDAWAEGATLSLDEALDLVSVLPPEDAQAGRPGSVAEDLTRREKEVAGLIARGLTNRDIARLLVISQATAKKHVENILAKMGMSTRAEVAAWAARSGLAEAEPD